MSPSKFKETRRSLGLSQSEMAFALGISSDRAIRYYESGDREVSGPISILMNVFLCDPSLMGKYG